MARSADEGKPLNVFIMAGAFSDKNKVRMRVAVAKYNGMTMAVQLAALAVAQVTRNALQSIALDALGG